MRPSSQTCTGGPITRASRLRILCQMVGKSTPAHGRDAVLHQPICRLLLRHGQSLREHTQAPDCNCRFDLHQSARSDFTRSAPIEPAGSSGWQSHATYWCGGASLRPPLAMEFCCCVTSTWVSLNCCAATGLRVSSNLYCNRWWA